MILDSPKEGGKARNAERITNIVRQLKLLRIQTVSAAQHGATAVTAIRLSMLRILVLLYTLRLSLARV